MRLKHFFVLPSEITKYQKHNNIRLTFLCEILVAVVVDLMKQHHWIFFWRVVGRKIYSFSRERELVSSSRVSRQACLAALSSDAGGLPRKRSSDGRK